MTLDSQVKSKLGRHPEMNINGRISKLVFFSRYQNVEILLLQFFDTHDKEVYVIVHNKNMYLKNENLLFSIT